VVLLGPNAHEHHGFILRRKGKRSVKLKSRLHLGRIEEYKKS